MLVRTSRLGVILCVFAAAVSAQSGDGLNVQDQLVRGNRDGAIRALSQASSQLESMPDTEESVGVLRQMADQYLQLGAKSNAVAVLNRSIVIAKKYQPESVVGLLESLGKVQGESENHLLAKRIFKEQLTLIPESEHLQRATAYTNILKAEVRSLDAANSVAETVTGFKAAIDALGNDAAICGLELPFAATLLMSAHALAYGDYIEQLLVRSLASAKVLNNERDEISAIGLQANMAGVNGDAARALNLARQALSLSVNAYPELAYRWQWQIGSIKATQGQRSDSIADYLAAIDTLSGIQSEMLSGSYLTFQERVLPVYYELIDLLLAEADSAVSDDQKQALLLEVQRTVEALNKSEVLDYFDDDCLLPTEVTELADISADTVVVYPIVLADRVVVIAKFADGIHMSSKKIKRETLDDQVHRYRESIEGLEFTDEEIKSRSSHLYDLIVRPFESSLAKFEVKRLVFIPSSGFRTIPMSALYDGRQYLVEKYQLATTLGLGLTDPRPLTATGSKPLLGGISESVQGFIALPGVMTEISDIERMLGGDVLLNSSFTLDNVADKLAGGGYSIVHLATHGVFVREASNSYLLAFDQKLTLDRLRDTVGSRRYLGEPLDLLVLSACETAAGDEKAALGLAGVTLKAGARSTIASLWPISDGATAKLMTDFYGHLKSGVGKAEALRLAQMGLVNDARFSHPNFWSPFLLIGNWL